MIGVIALVAVMLAIGAWETRRRDRARGSARDRARALPGADDAGEI